MINYGLLPDKEDPRDFLFLQAPVKNKEMPNSIDLRNLQGPITDQGHLGACTGHALAGLRTYLERKSPSFIDGKAGKENINININTCPERSIWGNIKNYVNSLFVSRKVEQYSPLFIYYEIRRKEGTLDRDSGGTIRTGMKILNSVGACSEKIWPYKIRNFNIEPPRKAYRTARKNQVLSYYRITDENKIQHMKIALSNKLGIVGGLMIHTNFYNVSSEGFIRDLNSKDSQIGGHAILFCGFNDLLKCFIIRNSWGTNWGKKGYAFISYDYVEKYSVDLWVANEWE
jgi:hypothetical protein